MLKNKIIFFSKITTIILFFAIAFLAWQQDWAVFNFSFQNEEQEVDKLAQESKHGVAEKKQKTVQKKRVKQVNWHKKALTEQDIAWCNQIPEKKQKERCSNQVLYALALENERYDSLCEEITKPELAQKCKQEVAFSYIFKNIETGSCDKITDKLANQKCQKIFKTAQATAQQIRVTNSLKADSLSSTSVTEKIANCPDDICQATAYIAWAEQEKDASFCQKIANQTERDKCERQTGSKIEIYWLRQAIAKKDLKLCQKIFNEKLKIFCAAEVSREVAKL